MRAWQPVKVVKPDDHPRINQAGYTLDATPDNAETVTVRFDLEQDGVRDETMLVSSLFPLG